jgi:hypothetical protein
MQLSSYPIGVGLQPAHDAHKLTCPERWTFLAFGSRETGTCW